MTSTRQFDRPKVPLPNPIESTRPDSFAYATMSKRKPGIARRVLQENVFPVDVVERLESLIGEMPDGAIRPLEEEAPDAADWARYVRPYLGRNWLQVPWFFAETYFYRRILEATDYFQPGVTQGLDPYASQKESSLEASQPAIRSLGEFLEVGLRAKDWVGKKDSLERLILMDLWSNQADLSIWSVGGRPEHADIERQQAHLLVNQTSAAIDHLSGLDGRSPVVDFLLDNAGTELLHDLGLADYLLSAGLARRVRLHAKAHPTYVSDAMIKDVVHTLDHLEAHAEPRAQDIASRLKGHLESKKLLLIEDFFWNSPLSSWEMPVRLWEALGQADLVISKGDANYRRLIGDRQWPPTTPFGEVVCYYPAPLAALRVLKSEVALGMPPGRAEQLDGEDPGWMVNGRWGVIQFVSL